MVAEQIEPVQGKELGDVGANFKRATLVELVHLYSNPKVRLETLQRLIVATPSARRTYGLPSLLLYVRPCTAMGQSARVRG
jgi:hypothetical protein